MEPDDLATELGRLTGAYNAELARLGACDRGMLRRRAVERLTRELGAWNGAPVFAYGFEDLTAAEWRLIEALAARGDVHVSLPYEPARAAFASLSGRSTDLAALAGGDMSSSGRSDAYLPPGSRVSNAICSTTRRAGAARRLDPLPRRRGRRPRWSSSPRPCSISSAKEPLRTRSRSSVPPSSACALRSRRHSARSGFPSRSSRARGSVPTAFGQALLSLLRFTWSSGTRRELFSFLRTPYAGLARPTSTSSRAACAGAPCSVATARSRRRRSCARGGRCRCWS